MKLSHMRERWYNGRMKTVALADRPDLAEATFAIPYGADTGSFMQESPVALLVRRRRLAERWPAHVLVSSAQDVGMYVEPNIWVSHRL